MNLLRLAKFNIRKHKTATLSLVILLFFCQLFLGLAIHNMKDNGNLFLEKSQAMEAVQNIFCIETSLYKEDYEDILKADSRVSKVVTQDAVFLWDSVLTFKDGSEHTINSVFINKEAGNHLEKINLESTMEKADINKIEHPIYVPYVVGEYYGFNEGDEYKLIYHQREYTFTIAGFFETTVLANENMGAIKYIISERDYEKLRTVCGENKILGYNVFDLNHCRAVAQDFTEKAKAMADTGKSFQVILAIDYVALSGVATMFPVLLAYLLLVFAIIIFITIFIVIRHRIANNIEEQMASIGTLEALGYTSKQITKVYMIEYSLLACVGSLFGIILSKVFAPMLNQFSFNMLGLKVEERLDLGIDILMMLGIIGATLLMSFCKAWRVKKYPPVIAFRKGINNHHFKKNYFALEKTKSSVHFRLALKRFLGAIRQNSIIAVCVCVVTAAMMFSVILYSCCGKDQDGVMRMTGMEMCDLTIDMTHSIEPEAFREELREMSEVRKVNLSHTLINVSLQSMDVLSIIFQDYDETENIYAYEGRLPKYDNEVLITGALARGLGKEVGDSLEVEYNGYSMQYLISGISQSMINNGQTLYFTEEAIKHIVPSYQSDELSIYLKEDVDKKAFISKIKEAYGKSIEDLKKEALDETASKEDRIRAKAQAKVASLMSLYGVDSIDYAVMIDGRLIKGNSKVFSINKISDIEEQILTGIGAYIQGVNWGTKIIIVVAAIVIVVILIMLIKASIIRQKMDLGIYKSLGYTTLELMLQITLSLMPAIVVGVIIGIGLAVWGSPAILSQTFSVIGVTHMLVDVNVFDTLLLGIGIISLSFVTIMLSTYKIKDISAYQLLTE